MPEAWVEALILKLYYGDQGANQGANQWRDLAQLSPVALWAHSGSLSFNKANVGFALLQRERDSRSAF